MREEAADVNRFLEANRETTCIQLIPCLETAGTAGLDLLCQIAQFWKLLLENKDDIDELKCLYLVWYKPNEQGEAGWEKAGSQNYTVAEYAYLIRAGAVHREDIRDLAKSLKSGLKHDIVLTVAFDTLLNKRVIVDGCKRAVALALIAEENQRELLELLASKFRIVIMELRSRWAHSLYPCDFLNFCARNI